VPEPVEASADTVEEAIDEVLAMLGATEDEVEIRVLSEGATPARPNDRARVSARLRDEGEAGEGGTPRTETAPPPASEEELDEEADVAEDFLNELLDEMDVDADVDVAIEAGVVSAELDGDDAGLLIGRHGATIEAIQEIVRTVVKTKTGRWSNLTVDVEGYRARRQDQLEARARSLAEKVKRSGEAIDMPAMSSSERKIVHQTLSGIPGVRSESEGQGAERHIVIHPA
jgi:spoIIIJ-associated protein